VLVATVASLNPDILKLLFDQNSVKAGILVDIKSLTKLTNFSGINVSKVAKS
jgi:hypothetical protein